MPSPLRAPHLEGGLQIARRERARSRERRARVGAALLAQREHPGAHRARSARGPAAAAGGAPVRMRAPEVEMRLCTAGPHGERGRVAAAGGGRVALRRADVALPPRRSACAQERRARLHAGRGCSRNGRPARRPARLVDQRGRAGGRHGQRRVRPQPRRAHVAAQQRQAAQQRRRERARVRRLVRKALPGSAKPPARPAVYSWSNSRPVHAACEKRLSNSVPANTLV